MKRAEESMQQVEGEKNEAVDFMDDQNIIARIDNYHFQLDSYVIFSEILPFCRIEYQRTDRLSEIK